jgi:hypothetical protein
MKLYSVKNWNGHFENNRTSDLKEMQWVPVPNKHDGEGFTDLLTRENGAALYGAWVLILQVASKCDPRGTLLRTTTGTPHTAATIARLVRCDEVLIGQALSILVEIGWLEVVEYDAPQTVLTAEVQKPLQNPARTCGEAAPYCGLLPSIPHPTDYGMEWKGMEGNGRTACAEPPKAAASAPEDSSEILFTFETVGKGPKEWHFRDSLRIELSGLFPGVDVVGETRKSLAWMRAKPQNRKTHSGMRSFLTNWLTRATDRGGRAQSVTMTSTQTRFREVVDHKKNHPLAELLGPNLDGKVPY